MQHIGEKQRTFTLPLPSPQAWNLSRATCTGSSGLPKSPRLKLSLESPKISLGTGRLQAGTEGGCFKGERGDGGRQFQPHGHHRSWLQAQPASWRSRENVCTPSDSRHPHSQTLFFLCPCDSCTLKVIRRAWGRTWCHSVYTHAWASLLPKCHRRKGSPLLFSHCSLLLIFLKLQVLFADGRDQGIMKCLGTFRAPDTKQG